MSVIIWTLGGFLIGYIAAIWTWSLIRARLINGYEIEAAKLRARAAALTKKL
jgi:biotin transporter BioY